MKKICLLLVCFAAAAIFCACADIKAEYSIGNENTVTAVYTINIDRTKINDDYADIDSYVNDISVYWKRQQMDVDITRGNNKILIKGIKIYNAQSRQEAFDKLKETLCGEYSPFDKADFEFAGSYFKSKYYINGVISLKDVIRKDEKKTIPKDLLVKVLNAAESCTYSIKITLPGDIQNTNSGKKETRDGLSSCRWSLKYGETKDITLRTLYNDIDNVKNYERLKNEENLYNMIFYAGIGLGAASFITAVVIVIRNKRIRNAKKTSIQV